MKKLLPAQIKMIKDVIPYYDTKHTDDRRILNKLKRIIQDGFYIEGDTKTLNEIRKYHKYGIFEKEISEDEFNRRISKMVWNEKL